MSSELPEEPPGGVLTVPSEEVSPDESAGISPDPSSSRPAETEAPVAKQKQTPAGPFIRKYQEGPVPDKAATTVEGASEPGRMAAGESPIPGELPVRKGIQPYAMSSFTHRDIRDRIRSLDLPRTDISEYSDDETYANTEIRNVIKDFTEKNNISALSLANAGINRIGQLTGSEMAMETSRDQEGGISGFRFSSRWLNVSAPVGKSK